MNTSPVYVASSIKRQRRTKADMGVIRHAILAIIAEESPLTCRQAFYRLVAKGVIDKTQAEYQGTVCRLLTEMRREGAIGWHEIADNTRWMRKPRTYSSLEAMLESSYRCYRRSVWDDQDAYVEIWCESDAIAGVLVDVTSTWDVPLMVSRGFSSVTFLHNAALNISEQHKPAHLYYFGDYDPSGVVIDRKIESELRAFAPNAEITFSRMAVTAKQIEEWSLPGAPPKKSDSRTKTFSGTNSVEIESIPPSVLRALVGECIEQHVDEYRLQQMKVVEAAERETLRAFARHLQGGDL